MRELNNIRQTRVAGHWKLIVYPINQRQHIPLTPRFSLFSSLFMLNWFLISHCQYNYCVEDGTISSTKQFTKGDMYAYGSVPALGTPFTVTS